MNRPLDLSWESIQKDPHRFNGIEHSNFSWDAADWRCCAVGEKLGLHSQPNHVKGVIGMCLETHYPEISYLGNRFGWVVSQHDWAAATRIYKRITELMTPAVVADLQAKIMIVADVYNVLVPAPKLDVPQIMEVVVGTQRRQAPASTGGVPA